MTHSNDLFGPLIYVFSFLTISFSGLFHAFQVLGMLVGILSGLLVGSWFLSLHIERMNNFYNGSIRNYLKSFKSKKPQ